MEMGGSRLFQAGTRYPDSVRGSPGAYATETRTKCCREGRRMVSARWEGGSVRSAGSSRIGAMPGGGNTSLHFTSSNPYS